MLLDLILYIFLVYILVSIFVFFVVNSNLLPFRLFSKYRIDIPVEFKKSTSGIGYWFAQQNKSNGKSVILLHGFTRNSGMMNNRAKYYWDNGYDVYFADNLGHGKSKFVLFPSGFEYSRKILEIINTEELHKPIIHGVSMGAIASSYIGQKEIDMPKMIICEALPHDFDKLYDEIMRYMKFPIWLFFWIDWFSKKTVWRKFTQESYQYDLSTITVPFLLINSESDRMFSPEDHFEKIVSDFEDRDNFESWLVPNSGHTRMDQHQNYIAKLATFITRHS